MGPSSTEIPAEVFAHSIHSGYENRKPRLEIAKESPNTRTVESSLEEKRDQQSWCHGHYSWLNKGQENWCRRKDRAYEGRQCFTCKKQGHLSRNCPQRPPQCPRTNVRASTSQIEEVNSDDKESAKVRSGKKNILLPKLWRYWGRQKTMRRTPSYRSSSWRRIFRTLKPHSLS